MSLLLTGGSQRSYQLWHLLRVLDELTNSDDQRFGDYVSSECLFEMSNDGVVELRDGRYSVSGHFRDAFDEVLHEHFRVVEGQDAEAAVLAPIPSYWLYQNEVFVPLGPARS